MKWTGCQRICLILRNTITIKNVISTVFSTVETVFEDYYYADLLRLEGQIVTQHVCFPLGRPIPMPSDSPCRNHKQGSASHHVLQLILPSNLPMKDDI